MSNFGNQLPLKLLSVAGKVLFLIGCKSEILTTISKHWTFLFVCLFSVVAFSTDYNEVFKVNIDRKNRSLGRIFKRQPCKLEVKYER